MTGVTQSASSAAELEAAATPTGPCPAWCALADGHPFTADSIPGFQYRDHEIDSAGWCTIVAREAYSEGTLQPIKPIELNVWDNWLTVAPDFADRIEQTAVLLREIQASSGVTA